MSIGASISVVVIDDHDLLREGVSACLAANLDIVVIGEATSGESAVSMAASHEPDVVVIDLVMPGLGGVGAIRQIRAAHPTMAILALSSFYERDRVHEVLDAGADGYLVKSVDAESLAHAVRSVARGQGAFSPEVTRALAPNTPSWDRSLASLTARELDVAELVAEGRTNAEIASQLGLSVFTVKNHVSSLLAKLHAQTRTEAAALVLHARGRHSRE
jgi:NarL family two-component system response regulator LiaR